MNTDNTNKLRAEKKKLESQLKILLENTRTTRLASAHGESLEEKNKAELQKRIEDINRQIDQFIEPVVSSQSNTLTTTTVTSTAIAFTLPVNSISNPISSTKSNFTNIQVNSSQDMVFRSPQFPSKNVESEGAINKTINLASDGNSYKNEYEKLKKDMQIMNREFKE